MKRGGAPLLTYIAVRCKLLYMKYSEIFYSIQGEGALAGVPSVFFRTSYCNLRCVWCDTPYTSWEPENKDISVEEAAEAILRYNCPHVVITGGEPTIQADELTKLCAALSDAGMHITIETNGTVYVPVQADLISISPKLSNSNPPPESRAFQFHQAKRVNLTVIRQYLQSHECQVKFVVDAPSDLAEIERIVKEAEIPPRQTLLMPQGVSTDETRPKMRQLAEICRQKGYRLSPRLHVDIWGNRRGV